MILRGVILLLGSAVAFAVASMCAKLVALQAGVPGIQVCFTRFLIGFVVCGAYVIRTKTSLRPRRLRWVLARAGTNLAAAILLFAAIPLTTVTNANMLNMTYPVFVFLLAPIINSERNRPIGYLYLAMTLLGVYLVVIPDLRNINTGDVYAFLSGVAAAFAVTSLRQARKYDGTGLILFYLMAIGLPICLVFMLPVFVAVRGWTLVLLVASGTTAFLGQIMITAGYRHISAAPGALVSSSRIIIAAVLGALLFNDPITWRTMAGGLLILIALAGVSGVAQWLRRPAGRPRVSQVEVEGDTP